MTTPPPDTTGVNAVLLVVANPPGADGDTMSPLGVVRSSLGVSCLVVVLASMLSVPTKTIINKNHGTFQKKIIKNIFDVFVLHDRQTDGQSKLYT